MIGTSDQIVSEQVAEQEKISGLSRQFTYINSQVLTHVMTTNSVTMDTLSEKILQDITDMEQRIEEFGYLLSEGDERKEALDSVSAELAKYRKTVESLLVTSAENKTQAYVSATADRTMRNLGVMSRGMQLVTRGNRRCTAGYRCIGSHGGKYAGSSPKRKKLRSGYQGKSR